MALLEEQFTETLDAGAPDITYQGNEGKEQKIARQLWDQLPNQVRMQFGSFEQFFQSGAWKEVLARLQQAQEQTPERIQETETIQEQPQQGLASMMPAQMADGGRPGYFVGKLVKKITKPIKKLVKSPIGKAALMYAGTAGLGNLAGGLGGAQPWMSGKWLLPKNIGANLFGSIMSGGGTDVITKPGLLEKLKLTKGGGSMMPTALGWGAAASLAPFAMQAAGKWDTGEQEIDSLKAKAAEFGFDYSQMIQDLQAAVATGSEAELAKVLSNYNLSRGDMSAAPYIGTAAEGGRIGYAGGGSADYYADLYSKYAQEMIQAGNTPIPIEDFVAIMKEQGHAQGGRIGYAGGGLLNILRRLMTPEAKRFKKFNYSQGITDDYKMDTTQIMEEMAETIYGKPYSSLNKKQQMKIFDAANEERANIQSLIPEPDDFAQGGRIGYANGGDWDADWDDVIDPSDPDQPHPDWQPDWDDYLDVKKKKKKKRAKAQEGGRIGYAEGGWEAGDKQALISKLVDMGLPLPQAMKMAEMIIANATPEELQRAIAGTRRQGLTPEESIKFQENIITPEKDVSVTERVGEYLPDILRYKPMKGEYMRASMQGPEVSEIREKFRTPELRETIEEIRENLPEWTRDAEQVPGMEEEIEERDVHYGMGDNFRNFPPLVPKGWRKELLGRQDFNPVPIKRAEGGLMSLGGMEMDLRGGGFVPIGKVEKADDVPARLSKNEFVFTADAVRAAGDGDVDAGADKMYKTMKQLENRVG